MCPHSKIVKTVKEYFFLKDDLLVWRPLGVMDTNKIYEFMEFLNEQTSKKNYHFNRLIDLSHITSILVNYDDLYWIAKQRNEYADKSLTRMVKMAFYVKDSLSFGMARMYENLMQSTKFEIMIFYSLQEVAAFLQTDISLLEN